MGGVLNLLKKEILKSDLFSVILGVLGLLGTLMLFREGILNLDYFLKKRKKMKSLDGRVEQRTPNKSVADKKELEKYLIKGLLYLLISFCIMGYVFVNREKVFNFYGF